MKGFRHFLRRVAPIALVAGAALAAVAGAGTAQQSGTQPKATRKVIIRQDTNETMRVTVVLDGLDSLLRSLAQSRALEERIGIALREYAGAPASESRKRALEEQLQKISRSNLQIMSKIQMACTSQQAHAHDPEGYLGVTFSITGEMKRENNGPDVFRFDEPPEILTVESGSPADRAGIHPGDRMVAIDSRDVVGRDVLFGPLLVPGRKLPVRMNRDGHEQTFVVQVQKRPDGFGDQCADLDLSMLPMRTPGFAQVAPMPFPKGMIFSRPPSPPRAADAPEAPSAPNIPIWTFEMPPPVAIAGFSSLVAGAQLTTLTEDFKDLTGAAAGVLVQRVAPETPAALAGLKGGDVIVEAGGRQVTSARLLQRLISDTDARSLKLKVVRKGKARTAWLRW
jgi:membrane-associated protease RseP (regulator of RpoE activity)